MELNPSSQRERKISWPWRVPALTQRDSIGGGRKGKHEWKRKKERALGKAKGREGFGEKNEIFYLYLLPSTILA